MRLISAALVTLTLAVGSTAGAACLGDCNDDGSVTVDEILTGVNIALGASSVAACGAMDDNGDGQVTVDEILISITKALGGCSAVSTPTPTATATATQAAVATATAPPRPSVPPGCNKSDGYTRLVFSEEVGTNHLINASTPHDLFGVTGTTIASTRGLGTTSVTCPTKIDAAVVTFGTNIGGFPDDLAAGNTYPLHPGPVINPPQILISMVDYTERLPTDPLNANGWRANTGVLTVDSYSGDTLRVTVDAQMLPLPGTRATGSFHLQASVIVDKTAHN